MSRRIRLALIGFGSVHQHLVRILLERGPHLTAESGLELDVVGVADSGGAVYDATGLDVAALLAHKKTGYSVATLGVGTTFADALSLCRQADYDVLLEASPVNLQSGEPGLSCVRAALGRGRHCVLANKGPVVLDYAGLQQLAEAQQAKWAFSATVCGGLPVINVGRRDLVGAHIYRIEGIFNSTSNYILSRMTDGESFADALAEAQHRGIAEADPSLDIDGWDTAAKLLILVQSVLHFPAALDDVQVEGIRAMNLSQIIKAHRRGMVYKLVASAAQKNDGFSLTVQPKMVPADSFLGNTWGWQMSVIFFTDLYEEIYLKVDEKGPGATAAAMIRDVLTLIS